LQTPILGFANIMQTVPSLALFGLLIPIPFIGGIGARTAIIALALYALLPVIRNTVTGILGIDPKTREAAVAIGMTGGQILRIVELPLAAPVILTGIRVAVVISVGVATVAAGPVVFLAVLVVASFASGVKSEASNPTAITENPRIVVGSKDFTESVILAEILAQMLEKNGVIVTRQFELGGNIAHDSLLSKQ